MFCLKLNIPETQGYSLVIETKQVFKETISIKIGLNESDIWTHQQVDLVQFGL